MQQPSKLTVALQTSNSSTRKRKQEYQEFRASPAWAGPTFKKGVGHEVAKDFLHKCKDSIWIHRTHTRQDMAAPIYLQCSRGEVGGSSWARWPIVVSGKQESLTNKVSSED